MLALATTDIVSSIALYEIMKLSLTLDVCLFKKNLQVGHHKVRGQRYLQVWRST